ncbi:MAG: hypothetical protein JNM93_00685 [Bacteriovoracaceae bacterium]|nr:hypothetical protein [Bacteriovoracaceae bacterium]
MYYFNITLKILVLIFSLNLNAKVDPPNYNFSLDELAIFNPGSSISEIEKKYGPGLIIEKKGEITIFRFFVSQLRYKFPVIVQAKSAEVLDFYATLPSYFLHDVFHQSLINRIGKQNQYLLRDEHAVYVWNNVKNLKHTYSAACTITCFPIFYSVSRIDGERYQPLIDLFIENEKSVRNQKKN